MSRIPGGSLGTFFVLTYAVTWTCFISLATLAVSTRTPVGALVVLLGVFAPGLVALSLTARAEGGQGVRALLGRILRWRVAAHWYLFAAGYIAAIKLTVALVHRVATGPGRRGDRLARVRASPPDAAFRPRAREHPARGHLGLLAPAAVLHSRIRHVRTVILRLRVASDRAVRRYGMALCAHQRESAARHADARGGEQFQRDRPVDGAGRHEPAWAQRFPRCLAHGHVAMDLRRLLPRSHAGLGPARRHRPVPPTPFGRVTQLPPRAVRHAVAGARDRPPTPTTRERWPPPAYSRLGAASTGGGRF